MHKQTIGSGSQVWVNKNLFSSSSAAFSEILRIKYFASEEIIDHDMHMYYPCTVYHKERIIFSPKLPPEHLMFPNPLGGPIILPDVVKTNKTQWKLILLDMVELFYLLHTL